MIQGEVLKRVRGRVFGKKRDQRELMKVIQRNFRKFMSMREWGWFIIIQKTRPLIGSINLEEELRILEEQANLAYGAYAEALNVTKELEEINVQTQADLKDLTKQLEAEQGNLGIYHE